jgi:hypothetical protein
MGKRSREKVYVMGSTGIFDRKTQTSRIAKRYPALVNEVFAKETNNYETLTPKYLPTEVNGVISDMKSRHQLRTK